MERKGSLAILIAGLLLFGLFLYFRAPYGSEEKSKSETPKYSVDEMYARHSFEREFGKFSFWDIVSKKDVETLRYRVGDFNESKFEKIFYRTGIYTWPLYSSYAWDVTEANISCPANMTPEEFDALIRNVTAKYEKLRQRQEYYLTTFKKLEGEITEPRAYAFLAWLELQLVNNPDFNYERYAKEYGFSEGVCKSLLGLPEYYENSVFPYVDRGIEEVIKLNSESPDGKALSEKARTIIQNRGDKLFSELVLINKTKQGSLEAYGAYGLTYYELSKNTSTQGFNALALFYFSWAEGYYDISKEDVSKVPMRLDYPFNISMPREIVYTEAIDLLNQLHRDGFYTLDPLISQVVLYHLGRVEYRVLPKLQEENSTWYFLYPSKAYTEYLEVLVKIRGVKRFHEHLIDP